MKKIEKKTYCDLCGTEILRDDMVNVSINIKREEYIWDELGGKHVNSCEIKDICPKCIQKLYKGFQELGLKFEHKVVDRVRY